MGARTSQKTVLIMAVLLLGIHCATAVGRPIYVDANAPPGGDGSSWAAAYKYLQDAMADANSEPDPNDIWVAQGVYTPDSNSAEPDGTGDRTAAFQLISGVGIYGGFHSGGGDWSNRDPNAYETILSGDLDGNDVAVNHPRDLATEPTRTENSDHVVTGGGTDETAVLDGFTITGGNNNIVIDPEGDRIGGGGMYNYHGSPTVSNCTFRANSTLDRGGGMHNRDYSSPTVTDCTFQANAAYNGGGIQNNTYSDPAVVNCMFTENWAGAGGGMYNFFYCEPTIINCKFNGNSTGPYYGAAGIGNGGYSNPLLVNCIFTGNSAADEGGAVDNTWSTCTLVNCTFTANSATEGGAIYNYHSGSTLTNCILWGDTAALGNEIALEYDSTINISYSDVQGGWGGVGNSNQDPCFVDSDGGDNIVGTEDDDLRLRPDSPCIDAGDNTPVPADTTDLDNDGNTTERTPLDIDCGQRFADDPNTPDSGVPDPPDYNDIVDMGAYEYRYYSNTCWDQSVCTGQPFGDATCDGNVNFLDLGALKVAFFSLKGDAGYNCCADFSHDGSIDFLDLGIIKVNFFTTGHSPSTGNQDCPP
ncbi:MAG TPA: hypothetical protein VMX13_08620 [Sedimentisphaerales bacterium]|nr:hypothetical protein [Sedimentisphaerales bacterium]